MFVYKLFGRSKRSKFLIMDFEVELCKLDLVVGEGDCGRSLKCCSEPKT